jgi:hypothetical protein
MIGPPDVHTAVENAELVFRGKLVKMDYADQVQERRLTDIISEGLKAPSLGCEGRTMQLL